MSYSDYQLNSSYNRDKCKPGKCVMENYDNMMENYDIIIKEELPKTIMESCKIKPMDCSKIADDNKCEQNLNGVTNDYAKAYIVPQVYENIFAMNDALCKGTIFKDLYKPYKEQQKCYY